MSTNALLLSGYGLLLLGFLFGYVVRARFWR